MSSGLGVAFARLSLPQGRVDLRRGHDQAAHDEQAEQQRRRDPENAVGPLLRERIRRQEVDRRRSGSRQGRDRTASAPGTSAVQRRPGAAAAARRAARRRRSPPRPRSSQHAQSSRPGPQPAREAAQEEEAQNPGEKHDGRLHGRLRRGGALVGPHQPVDADQHAQRRSASPRSAAARRQAAHTRGSSSSRCSGTRSRRDPPGPTACAAAFGESEITPAMTPNPPTKTSASGNNQRNSRKASAPAMIPPPTSTSVSTISKTASRDE